MILRSLRVGLFLAVRYIKGASAWTTLLIVFIMLLTFLNVIVVRGILIGLPEGSQLAYEKQFAGDVILTPAANRSRIEQTPYVINIIENTSGYDRHSVRYTQGGTLVANFTESRSPRETADSIGTVIAGIDPVKEDALTHLADLIIEGEYLDRDDVRGIMVGNQLLDRYSVVGGSENGTVSGVYPGDRVRILINGFEREYVVRGVIKSKAGENSRRVFITDREARAVMGRFDRSANEIAVKLIPGEDPVTYKNKVIGAGVADYAEVQTAAESLGQFLEDIRNTFEVLSTVIGVIGIAVATITVFIVIFIFAITRQKQIGILKGIGISKLAIESSFVFLSIFYAVLGISLGAFVLYFMIQPYVLENPINFPFADGLLVAPYDETFIRSVFIMIATLVAGYIPARMIIKKNTINAILGR